MTGFPRRVAWASSPREAWTVAAAWAALLFTLSSIPGDRYPRVDVRFADKYVHFLMFVPLGFALARAFSTGTIQGRHTAFSHPVGRTIAATVATSVYGVTDELHQTLVPMRSCDVNDWIVDSAAGFAGAVTFASVRGLARVVSAPPPRPIDP